MQRRLTAIMAADVVGYSRLMGANEVATLAALNQRRIELIEPRIACYRGRVVKLLGDGLLAEFPSVVDAVQCACEVQEAMAAGNNDVPEDRRIVLRIGINLGDVIVEGDDIFGDGVNVAARIESVARPGGVAVSATVRDHVGNRIAAAFLARGPQQLKNIAAPVEVFDVVAKDSPAPVATAATAASGPAAAERVSIAVLPFVNMSGDPEQDYFSDGITEDLITDLGKVSGLFVIGRSVGAALRGETRHPPQVAAELGVRFLLEGSVRKVGQRLRITGKLVEGQSGGQLWAERFDRNLTDIFAIQDEITATIVDRLKVHLMSGERAALGQAPTSSAEAYNAYLKGRKFFHSATRRFFEMARRMFVKATELDPDFARAYAGIASCDARLAGWFGAVIPGEEIKAFADRAIALDPDLAEAHVARGDALSLLGDKPAAVAEYEAALALDSNGFDANFAYAMFCMMEGKAEKAAELLIRSIELRPDDSHAALFVPAVLESLGRFEEAEKYGRIGIKRAEDSLRLNPESSRPAQLGAAYLARRGMADEARAWLETALAIDPEDVVLHYNAACTWAQLGEADRAFELLDYWLDHVGHETKQWLRNDADFTPLHGDPRFARLLERIAGPAP